MTYSVKTGRADSASLFTWLEQQLNPEWLSDARQDDHPLKRALRAHRDPGQNRAILLSDDLPRALAFANTLQGLSQFPTRRQSGLIKRDQFFRDQLINRAKQSIAEFDAAEIEGTVAWAYAGVLKQPIIALEPGNKPTPDFEVTIQGLPLFVECKARTTAPPFHRQINNTCSEIGRRVRPLLDSAAVNYGVCVSTTKSPERAVISGLVKSLRPLLASGQAFSSSCGDFNIEATILLSKDEEVVTPTLEPFDSDQHVPEPVRTFMIRSGVSDPRTYAWVHHQCRMRAEAGAIYYQNPKVLVVHIAVPFDHVEATARLIKDGRKQLPQTAPGIIAVRAPDFYGSSQFLQLGQAISHTLRATSRVSGVVLWHQAIHREIRSPTDWDQSLWWQLYWIRNERAHYPLPPSFASRHLPCGEGFEVLNRIATDA